MQLCNGHGEIRLAYCFLKRFQRVSASKEDTVGPDRAEDIVLRLGPQFFRNGKGLRGPYAGEDAGLRKITALTRQRCGRRCMTRLNGFELSMLTVLGASLSLKSVHRREPRCICSEQQFHGASKDCVERDGKQSRSEFGDQCNADKRIEVHSANGGDVTSNATFNRHCHGHKLLGGRPASRPTG